MKILSKTVLVTSVLAIFLVSACQSTKEYSPKDMHLPEEFQMPDSIAVQMDSVMIPWQEFFKDTTLKQIISKAFKQNFSIREADKEIEINKQYYKQSKVAFLPQFNLGLLNIEREWRSHYSRSGSESGYYDAKKNHPPKNMYVSKSIFSSGGALDWEIDIWGKFRKSRKASEAYYNQSFEMKKALKTEVVATIAQDYYTLLMLDEQLEVAKQNEHFRDSTLNIIQLQYDAGEVTALAVQQSKNQVLEAKALVPELEEQRTIQKNNLQLLTGELPQALKRSGGISNMEANYQNIQNIPLYLVQNRPDVLKAQYNLAAANQLVGVAQVRRYPSIDISISGGLESQLGKNWFNVPGALFGNFVGGLTAPVLNGRKLKTDYEVAKLERDKAEINFQHVVYQAVVDIKNSLVSIDKLKIQLKIAEEHQEVSQSAVKSSRMLFRSGFATYLEVIQAQGEALQADLNLVRAKTNLLTARVQLYRALGGGWQ